MEKKDIKVAYERCPISVTANDVVVFDTCVLMSMWRREVLECVSRLCADKNIVITEESILELEHLCNSANTMKRRDANAGLQFLHDHADAVVVHRKSFQGQFADPAILALCDGLSAVGYDVSVLTFDIDLTRDLLSRGRLYCSNCSKPVKVYKIDTDGCPCRACLDDRCVRNETLSVKPGFLRGIISRIFA